ncbi:uncharacterized protein G2W53_021013 [Senna tora]|uniref:Uncharacterized protein n=1 Tax=Senna tora TaxID=362788 RepID=A0A834TS51_9FABA|nr:uncharacterized protein G2W53_021013 [Senna tora]
MEYRKKTQNPKIDGNKIRSKDERRSREGGEREGEDKELTGASIYLKTSQFFVKAEQRESSLIK